MNFGAIRTAAQNNGRFDVSQDTVMKDWVAAAYSAIWTETDWQFKSVQDATLAITAGTGAPTMPTDFGDEPEIWDQYGDPLKFMNATDFNDRYRSDIINGRTGQPEAFKVVNRVLTLGPTPNLTTSFALNYDRRVCTYQSDGTTVRIDGFASASAADTDIPFWGAPHHMVIVFKTIEIGQGLESDNGAIMVSELGLDAFDAMKKELAQIEAPPRQWGSVRVGGSRW